ncbi:LysR family transcriptional regulator [Orrella sp. JC864]|uniref:LysR family transcriptional regulator n=1 Tax=Orrella sp. JC864 TaxID=3120298 RepID=UPI0012BB5D7F
MNNLSDLSFFACINRLGSLAAAAQELGVTPPAVSKRLAALEARLGVRLLHRTTRRIHLTPEGERYLVEGTRIIEALEGLERSISDSSDMPYGLLKVGATLGFGRQHIAPALADFTRLYPKVELQLYLSDRQLNLVDLGLDLVVHFGEIPDVRLAARLLAHNRRILCAAPSYLEAAGMPDTPRQLASHRCIVIRESDDTFGTWHLRNGTRQESVKVRGAMSTNDGASAVAWALAGQGIIARSTWDVAEHLRSGALRQVLPQWEMAPADIYLVFPSQNNRAQRVRAIVDFLLARFAGHRGRGARAATGRW